MKDKRFKVGYLVAVMAKPTIVGAAYDEISASLEQAFIRAGLVYKKV
jgi:hypothetical protein